MSRVIRIDGEVEAVIRSRQEQERAEGRRVSMSDALALLLAELEDGGWECAGCNEVFHGEPHSVETERPSATSPGDGVDLCDDCWRSREDGLEARAEAMAEDRAGW